MKKIYLIIFFLLLIPISFPISLNELINFFNYDFFTSEINVTLQNDIMIDKNNNGIDDTLIIELTTSNIAGTYFFVLDLFDNENINTNQTNTILNSGENKINISFSTQLLESNKFNFSIKIYNNNFSLKFRQDNYQTNFYSNYEKGIKLINIQDKNINNNSILLNLTLNITSNSTYEIFSYLKYNDSIIFKKLNKILSEGIQNAEIYFDNETIKNTHYIGIFNLTNIKINEKAIKLNYLTSIYDYRDFAQTSYIFDFSDEAFDTNNNNLFDYLNLNFNLEIKNDDNYIVEVSLSDLFDNFIAKETKTEFLETGINTFQIEINGTRIYNKKLNGPFKVDYVKLMKNNVLIDQLDNLITSNYNYTSFEKPPLPDLIVNITTDNKNKFGNNDISFNVSIKNIGTKAAFNIFLELFDNNTFSSNISKNILTKNDEVFYNFILNNINDTKLIGIVDFNDFIEEINESNNIFEKIIIINKKPILNNISNITANASDLIIINLNATDPNNDSLTYTINMTQFIQINNSFQWQTTKNDPGNHTALINVSDGYLFDFKIINIEILNLARDCIVDFRCTDWSECIEGKRFRRCRDRNRCRDRIIREEISCDIN